MDLTNDEIEILYDSLNGCDIREDYSGKGMLGETTTAIVTQYSKEEIIFTLEDIASNLYNDDEREYNNEYIKLIDKIKDARVDSIGKYNIVIY